LKVLIIGFGSIGKRHFEILSEFENVETIDLVTRQDLENIQTYKKLEDITDLSFYDYFIISSETLKHYEQLKYICSQVQKKTILVEKPLYDKNYEAFSCDNNIYVAYNLRFHPVLVTLHKLLKDRKIYFSNIICGQYLPTWRPTQDYRESYSADISQGGGVLRDLSHELDYISWLFGDLIHVNAINTKVSDLEINSDDMCTAIAVTQEKVVVNFSIDYISKKTMRRLVIHTENGTIEADLINNSIVEYDKESNATRHEVKQSDRNYTYTKMHESILSNNTSQVCTMSEGLKIMNIIQNIEFKEL